MYNSTKLVNILLCVFIKFLCIITYNSSIMSVNFYSPSFLNLSFNYLNFFTLKEWMNIKNTY
jgi:hypothetical protein